MKKTIQSLGAAFLLLYPAVTFAAAANFKAFIDNITRLLNLVIPITFALALLAFFWGLLKFIYFSAGSEHAREEGKNIMVWGVLAIFVMLSMWGFVRILQETILGGSGGAVLGPNNYMGF